MSEEILIVDDEPVNRQVLCDYLSMQGYHLVEASSGAEALDILNDEQIKTIRNSLNKGGKHGKR